MGKNSRRPAPGGAFRFRVSDSFDIPLRGHLLRLKLDEGDPSMKDLAPGRKVRVTAPSGAGRDIGIVGHSATGGIATQKRLDATGELDLVIGKDDAGEGVEQIGIGWVVTGPVA